MIRITVISLARLIASLVGIVAFTSVLAFAQSEIDPDHFDSPNTEPVLQPKAHPGAKSTVTRYNGKFTLPYIVQCNGKTLLPGEYSLSLRFDEKTGQGTLTSKNQSVGVVGVVQRLERGARRDALIVENKRNSRTLAVIRFAELDFVLGPQQRRNELSNDKHSLTESLPLVARKYGE